METDWQLEKKTLEDRYEHLWKTGDKSDCLFRAGGKIFPSHKLILFAASPVFERMFFGEIKIEADQIIEIGDIESDDFKDLLYFVYCNTIEIKTIEKAINLYYGAKKYMLHGLIEKCIEFLMELSQNTEYEYTCEIYEFAKFYEEQDLLKTVMKTIKKKPSDAINNAKNRVDISTVINILDEKSLNGTELSLFIALKNLAIIQNVIPSSSGGLDSELVENSELQLFQKLERLTKAQGIFAEEISAKALDVFNENKENVQVQHLRDFRNIQKCFGTTKMHIFQILNEISKINGREDVTDSSNTTTAAAVATTPAPVQITSPMPATVAAKPSNKTENIKADNLQQAPLDDAAAMSNDNVNANILKDNETFDDDTSAVCKRFALYQKFRIAVKKIEFLQMSHDSFYASCANSGLLLPEESLAIMACFIYKGNINAPKYPKDFRKNFRKSVS